ncbi:MAG: L-threonylcarbamoyladenylate synthase [Verrucomicrobiota bacterium]
MVLEPHEENIQLAIKILDEGQCIGLPTETVYGLAGNALNTQAIARIFEVKNRPVFDPLILHIADTNAYEKLQELAVIPEKNKSIIQTLIQAYWPGALTLILPKRNIIPELATANLPTLAIRCPHHPTAQLLLNTYGKPLAAPSANLFGRISPTTAEAVDEELGQRIPLILNGGPCHLGIESTIIDCSGPRPILLRRGAITEEEIMEKIGSLAPPEQTSHPVAPGMLKNHYAPRTPLYLLEAEAPLTQSLPKEYAYLFWNRTNHLPQYSKTLTPNTSFREAAAHLFSSLRALDQSPAKKIFCDPVPDENLGRAIKERLLKASSGTAIWDNRDFVLTDRE